jgi:hypothetical protein
MGDASDFVPIRIETRRLTLSQIAPFIEEPTNRVTAGRVAKIELLSERTDPPSSLRFRIGLGVITGEGLNLQRKGSLLVNYTSKSFIATMVRSSKCCFIESTPLDTGVVEYLPHAVQALCRILDDKTREPVTDLYVPVPHTTKLSQYLILLGSDDPPRRLNPEGQSGIVSVRYAQKASLFLAVRVNPQGRGIDIAMLPEEMTDPECIADPEYWQHLTLAPEGYAITMLSRPKVTSDGTIRLVVRLEDQQEALLVLLLRGNRLEPQWGTPVKTVRRVIGTVTGISGTFATYVPSEDSAHVEFASADDGPIATDYLRK